MSIYEFFKDQGSIIAGILAVAAAYGAIRETRHAAERTVAVAQDQIATTRRIERRRIARESYAFYATVEAAMAGVVEDVEKAWQKKADGDVSGPKSVTAYEIRQGIRKHAFDELRSAFLRLGGLLTSDFIGLERTIDEFASKCSTLGVPPAPPMRIGENAGIETGLNGISGRAKALREKASDGMRRCMDVLNEDQGPDLP